MSGYHGAKAAKGGEFVSNLKAADHEVILTGRFCEAKSGVRAGVASVIANSPGRITKDAGARSERRAAWRVSGRIFIRRRLCYMLAAAAIFVCGFLPMEIIDAHVHLYPPEVNRDPAGWAAAHGEAHWATLCTRARKDGRAVQAFPDVDELLRAMDAAGVARAVLQGWYWERGETCAWQNRFYEGCVRAHPDRLSACASLHPGAGVAAVRGIVRRAADAGFAGLGELSPHSQGAGVAVGDVAARDALHEAFVLAGEAGLAMCLHVTELAGEAGARNYPGKIETPIDDFIRWAQAFPKTRFVLAHWGARLPFDAEWGGAAKNLGNLFYDTAASPLVYGTDASAGIWREMVNATGSDRVLFGTDYPLALYPKDGGAGQSMAGLLAEARMSGLGNAELAAVLGENAKRIFGR